MRVPTLILSRSKSALFASKFLLAKNSVSIESVLCPSPQVHANYSDFPRLSSWFLAYHDGRPRGPLWRGKKLLGKEALFVVLVLKRFKDDNEKIDKFIKTHVLRLLKMDMSAVRNELERQEEVHLAVKYGSPADAMNIYEDTKKSPDLPEQLPFRILLKWLLPHPLLRNRVEPDFEEIFPVQHVYDLPPEIFGLQ